MPVKNNRPLLLMGVLFMFKIISPIEFPMHFLMIYLYKIIIFFSSNYDMRSTSISEEVLMSDKRISGGKEKVFITCENSRLPSVCAVDIDQQLLALLCQASSPFSKSASASYRFYIIILVV